MCHPLQAWGALCLCVIYNQFLNTPVIWQAQAQFSNITFSVCQTPIKIASLPSPNLSPRSALPGSQNTCQIIMFKSLTIISKAISVWNNSYPGALGAFNNGSGETQVSSFSPKDRFISACGSSNRNYELHHTISLCSMKSKYCCNHQSLKWKCYWSCNFLRILWTLDKDFSVSLVSVESRHWIGEWLKVHSQNNLGEKSLYFHKLFPYT